MIRAYDLLPDGTPRNMRVVYNFYPGRSADGMSIDTQGNLYAAAGLHRKRGTAETLDTKCGVYVILPQGKLLKFVPVPEDYYQHGIRRSGHNDALHHRREGATRSATTLRASRDKSSVVASLG